jgi:hypothetical protein
MRKLPEVGLVFFDEKIEAIVNAFGDIQDRDNLFSKVIFRGLPQS